jgi:hypothetical protein
MLVRGLHAAQSGCRPGRAHRLLTLTDAEGDGRVHASGIVLGGSPQCLGLGQLLPKPSPPDAARAAICERLQQSKTIQAVSDMVGDRALGDDQFASNLGIGLTSADQCGDLSLAWCQHGELLTCTGLVLGTKCAVRLRTEILDASLQQTEQLGDRFQILKISVTKPARCGACHQHTSVVVKLQWNKQRRADMKLLAKTGRAAGSSVISRLR